MAETSTDDGTLTGPPLGLRVRLIHGTLQRLADRAGVDVLHVKGPAVAEELLDTRTDTDPDTGEERTIRVPRGSSDADVLVRPAHVARFLDEVERNGWIRKTTFTSGSAFGHALNIYHPKLGNADVHRYFPGLEPDSFDAIWQRRGTVELGNVACTVPSLRAQRLLLLLHAARSGASHPDTQRAWGRATQAERDDVLALARELGAELGIAAAIGTLDDYRDHPDYLLWQYFRSSNPSRLDEWRARWRSATTLGAKATVVRNLIFFDPALLEAELGRRPTPADLARRIAGRFRTLGREVTSRVKGARR